MLTEFERCILISVRFNLGFRLWRGKPVAPIGLDLDEDDAAAGHDASASSPVVDAVVAEGDGIDSETGTAAAHNCARARKCAVYAAVEGSSSKKSDDNPSREAWLHKLKNG